MEFLDLKLKIVRSKSKATDNNSRRFLHGEVDFGLMNPLGKSLARLRCHANLVVMRINHLVILHI